MNSKISMSFSKITNWSQYIFIKKIYFVAQLVGFLLIFLWTVIVLLLDHLIILDLPFTWTCKEWHPAVYWLVGCIMAFLVLEIIFWLIKKKNNKSKGPDISWKLQKNGDKPSLKQKIMMLISTSCSGNMIDICFVISFFFYIAWIPDSCSDLVKGDSSLWRCFLYIGGLLVLILIKPTVYRDKKEVGNDKRTLLVTGLSYIRRNLQDTKMDSIKTTIMPFKKYKKIEKMMIVLSNHLEMNKNALKLNLDKPDDELENAYKRYKYKMAGLYYERHNGTYNQLDLDNAKTNEEWKKISNILFFCKEWKVASTDEDKEAVLSKYTLEFDLSVAEERDRTLLQGVKEALRHVIMDHIKMDYQDVNFDINNIEFTTPVNYNSFDECNAICYDKLFTLMKKGYSDENVIVNITAGTSPITSALTLNAIKGNREMVYVNQKSTEQLEKANPNVMMFVFDELWTERVEHE